MRIKLVMTNIKEIRKMLHKKENKNWSNIVGFCKRRNTLARKITSYLILENMIYVN